MVANVLIDNFLAGGPIMYPILITAVVAVAVVGERAFFWWREAGLVQERELSGRQRHRPVGDSPWRAGGAGGTDRGRSAAGRDVFG